MAWIVVGVSIFILGPLLAMTLLGWFMVFLCQKVYGTCSPRLPFLAKHSSALSPFRPLIRASANAVSEKVVRLGLEGTLFAPLAQLVLKKSAEMIRNSQGPPFSGVLLNLARFAWLGVLGSIFGAISMAAPVVVTIIFMKLLLTEGAAAYMPAMRSAGLGLSLTIGASLGMAATLSGPAALVKSEASIKLRRISTTRKAISTRSFQESALSIHGYPGLVTAPATYIYTSAAIVAYVIDDVGFWRLRRDVLPNSPAWLLATILAFLMLLNLAMAYVRVRLIRNKMAPTRALITLLKNLPSADPDPRQSGFYSRLPDPLGKYRQSLARLAASLGTSARVMRAEFRRLSVSHPLVSMLQQLSVGLRVFVSEATPNNNKALNDVREVMETVICYLAEPKDPDLLNLAATKVRDFCEARDDFEGIADRRTRQSINRIVQALELIDGPTKVVNAIAAVAFLAAAVVGINGGSYSWLTDLIK